MNITKDKNMEEIPKQLQEPMTLEISKFQGLRVLSGLQDSILKAKGNVLRHTTDVEVCLDERGREQSRQLVAAWLEDVEALSALRDYVRSCIFNGAAECSEPLRNSS
jgi:hypothetical protein